MASPKPIIPFAGLYEWVRYELFRTTWPRICGLVLVILAAAVYVPFLNNPLVFDDFNVINGTSFLDYTFQFQFAPRWFPYATLAHTYVLTDNSIDAMRWGNLICHAASAIAVFVLMREICLAVGNTGLDARQRESRALVVAVSAAALFAVHPVAVYGTGYLVQRTILMSTLFMLLMLVAYLRWVVTGRTALWVWSAVWYALAVFSKEHSVMAPAVAFVLTLVLHRPSLPLLRRLLAPFLTFAVIALVVISMVKGILGAAYEPYAIEMLKDAQLLAGEAQVSSYSLSVITQSLLFFKYWILWIFPNPGWMSIDVRVPLAPSLMAWPFGAAVLAFALYPLMTIGLAARGGQVGIAGWAMTFPWLMFATELSAIRVQEPFVLYRAYLWFPVVGAVAGLLLCRVSRRGALITVLAIVCALVPLSWNRLRSMSDTLLLWQDAARLLVRGDEAGAGRIYYNRGAALMAKRRWADALADLDRVVGLHPQMAPVYHTRARIHFELKQFTDALYDLNKSLALDPNPSGPYLLRGMTLRRMGRAEEAIKDLRAACERNDVFACYVAQQREVAGGAAEKR